MDDGLSLTKLIARRKLTRAVADLLRAQLREYLATLSPLFRPRAVLGEFVGTGKEAQKGPEQALAALRSQWESIATAKPYQLPKDLALPLELGTSTLDVTPLEYLHPVTDAGQTKQVVITAPLRWILTYAGQPAKRFREIMADPKRSATEVREHVLHALVLHTVVTRQPGLLQLLESLHYRVTTEQVAELGPLPLTCIASAMTTLRPEDDIIVAGTELSGMNVFEEVVDLESLSNLRDRLHERLAETFQAHGEAVD